MEENVTLDLLDIVDEFVSRQNAGDVPGVLRLLHRESMAFAPTQAALLDLFARFRLRFTLTAKRVAALDGDYAYVRLGLRTEKLDGPEFRDHVAESLVIFRNVAGQWKIWSQAPIEVQLL